MNLDSFSTVIDDRRYMKPEVYVDESNAFIENLRNTQGQRNEQIAQDTYNLGTAVPSNLGGLGGSSAYFNARYQTPYTNAVVADLRATAQAQALNEAMNNTLAQAKEKYNKAYKSYQRRVAAAKAARGNTGGGNTGGGADDTAPGTEDPVTGDVETEDTTKTGNLWSAPVRTDDVVYYGLYKLTRNQGESDAEWNSRSNKWLAQMALKNSMRSNTNPFME